MVAETIKLGCVVLYTYTARLEKMMTNGGNHPHRCKNVTSRKARRRRNVAIQKPIWTTDYCRGDYSLIIVNMSSLETMSIVFEASLYEDGEAIECRGRMLPRAINSATLGAFIKIFIDSLSKANQSNAF